MMQNFGTARKHSHRISRSCFISSKIKCKNSSEKTILGDNSMKQYASPRTTVVFVKAQRVLCNSNGNEPMREVDYGDGGFVEEEED